MIGVSTRMQRVYALVHQASAHSCAALITGEKGTGKRLAAETVHSLSQRRDKALVVVDSSQIAPTFAEPEIFGYEKGTFAGASHARWGLLAFARDGTILLKDVGDLPLYVQGRVLQVLQEQEFRPIGSSQALPFKARVLATTSRDLREEVKRGKFREELFLRLSAVQIDLPALRERREDIPLLADYFLESCAREGQPETKFSGAAMRRLCGHDWPGNVRELEKAVRRAHSISAGPTIEIGDSEVCGELPDDRRWASDVSSYLDERERHAITQALRESHGDKSSAARLLGIAESDLRKRLQYYNLR
jgi:DNA-binding NtrC family response regulator